MRFKFVMIDDNPTTDGEQQSIKIIHTFDALALDEILVNFTYFLRGCSFHVDNIEPVQNDE
jgi:hypothetical protein